ncbi:MAG: hypothetical protein ABI972_25610 [Acidobacteriota bacterium]
MSALKNHPPEGEWMAWIEGQLPPDQTARLSNHYLDCPLCSEMVGELRRALAVATRSAARPLPPGFLNEAKAEFLRSLPATVKGVHAHKTSLAAPASQWGLYRQLPNAVWFAAGIYFLITLTAWALWISSGEWSYMTSAFGLPYTVFLGFSAAAAGALSYSASRQFDPRHSLHSAWLVLFVAAACRLLGTGVSVLPSLFPDAGLSAMEGGGQFIAGPISIVALGIGLLFARRTYKAAGFRAELEWGDWLILGVGLLFTARHVAEVTGILISGPSKPAIVMLNWLADPALLFVLAVAVPLRRVAFAHNNNLIARCWGAMAGGALLIFLGNLLLFLGNYGYLAWPYRSITWLVWIPAYAAFTLGPAYQLAANGELAAQPALAPNTR